mmetsp:Transcript_6726/g.11841  ORF Transcript_6726/g.11841 Transcript_6726/m.11841 type:complete len:750 (+) Transcript_6726:226-2475(+)
MRRNKSRGLLKEAEEEARAAAEAVLRCEEELREFERQSVRNGFLPTNVSGSSRESPRQSRVRGRSHGAKRDDFRLQGERDEYEEEKRPELPPKPWVKRSKGESSVDVRHRTNRTTSVSRHRPTYEKKKSPVNKKERERSSGSKSQRGRQNEPVGLGSLLLAVILSATLLYFGSGSKDPDAMIGKPFPKPLLLATPREMAWKPSLPRLHAEEITLLRPEHLPPSVVQTRLLSALVTQERGTPLGGVVVSSEGIACGAYRNPSGLKSLVCVDGETGNPRWSAKLNFDTLPTRQLRRPVMVNGLIVYPETCKTLSAFHINDGTRVWSIPTPGNMCGAVELLVLHDINALVVVSEDGYMQALHPDNGMEKAPSRAISCSGSPCITSYVGTGPRGLLSFRGKASTSMARGAASNSKSSWFKRSSASMEALYLVALVDSDADLSEDFMFRVVKTTLLDTPRVGEVASTKAPVGISEDGRWVVVADGCVVRFLNGPDLAETFRYNLIDKGEDPTKCVVHSVVTSADSECFVTTDAMLHKFNLNADETPEYHWQVSFSETYQDLDSTEEARAMSPAQVMENGVLLRIGSSRGRVREFIQSALLLVDRGDGRVRWIAPSASIGFGDLAVDRTGAVYSSSLTGSVEVFRAVDAPASIREAKACALSRVQNAKASLASGGWFGGKSTSDQQSAVLDLMHSGSIIEQIHLMAERTGISHKSQPLKSLLDNMVGYTRSDKYILDNCKYTIGQLIVGLNALDV